MVSAQKIINRTGKIKFLKLLFKDGDYLLLKNLEDCDSVLDLGCGDLSTLRDLRCRVKVGVDINPKTIKAAKANKTHTEYLMADIRKVKYKPKSFDAVILIGVLEHLSKSEGKNLLGKMENWAIKKTIVSFPNGWVKQSASDYNAYQKHVSSWFFDDLIALGYKVRGITGAKFIYRNDMDIRFNKSEDKYALRNIKYNPRALFFVINAILQILVYYLPKYAATIFAVKNIKG